MAQILNVIDWLLLFACWILVELYLVIFVKIMQYNARNGEYIPPTKPLHIVSCLGTLLGTLVLHIGIPGVFPKYILFASTHPLNIPLCVIGFLLVLISFRTSWIYVHDFRIANRSRRS